MEEDILGPKKESIHGEFVLCDRCGKPIPSRRAELAEEGLGEDTLSQFEQLCDECRLPEPGEETPPE